MIQYFDELDDRNNQYLDLIKINRFKPRTIILEYLPQEFYQKYEKLFLEVQQLDVLYSLLDFGNKKVFWKFDVEEEYSFNSFFNFYINDEDVSDYNLTPDGKKRLDYLVSKIKDNYGDDYLDYLYRYMYSIITLFKLDSSALIQSREATYNYLESIMIIAKYQNRLSKDLETLIKMALEEIKLYRVEIPPKKSVPIKFNLPNCWYITPYKHLYNSMGKNGHKEANLIYPFYYTILRDDKTPDPKSSLKSLRETKNNAFITQSEYDNYLHLIYDFSSIYPESYYTKDYSSQHLYDLLYKKSYNPKLVDLIIGIKSAHAGLYNFFFLLRKYSQNYYEDLETIKEMDFNDILVRCCGFHKITSLPDKIITTSVINFEDEFEEYIRRGWQIDFIPPIIINEKDGRLEEYPDDFLTIRRILK